MSILSKVQRVLTWGYLCQTNRLIEELERFNRGYQTGQFQKRQVELETTPWPFPNTQPFGAPVREHTCCGGIDEVTPNTTRVTETTVYRGWWADWDYCIEMQDWEIYSWYCVFESDWTIIVEDGDGEEYPVSIAETKVITPV